MSNMLGIQVGTRGAHHAKQQARKGFGSDQESYLTDKMQPIAKMGYFFHLRKGRSTE